MISSENPKKIKEERKSGLTAQELEKVFAPPSEEAEAAFQKMLNWIERGLPKATDGAFLSSRVDW